MQLKWPWIAVRRREGTGSAVTRLVWDEQNLRRTITGDHGRVSGGEKWTWLPRAPSRGEGPL